jgi:hypothetical protein
MTKHKPNYTQQELLSILAEHASTPIGDSFKRFPLPSRVIFNSRQGMVVAQYIKESVNLTYYDKRDGSAIQVSLNTTGVIALVEFIREVFIDKINAEKLVED